MKICIIGAGVCGLASAKHCLENGFECEILEAKSDIGGTWLYTDRIGKDEYGYKLYSPMHYNLKTNLPTAIMSLSNFPHKSTDSFVSREVMLQYLHDYAKEFKLKPHVKLNRLVLKVTPSPDLTSNKWIVKSVDKASNKEYLNTYDSVMICTGIYNDPIIPKIQGIEYFKGKQMHSSEFRKPENTFKDQKILVIGSGSSSNDIILNSYKIAKNVVLSHHNPNYTNFKETENVTIKPDIKQINENGLIEFIDDSSYSSDLIVYCTGYKRRFDFLTEQEISLTLNDYYIRPLYKHVININHPTLCFIGLTNKAVLFPMFELQIRFYMEFLKGKMQLPSKEDMLKDEETSLKKRIKEKPNIYPKYVHQLFSYQSEYFEELANKANTENIPPAMVKMWVDSIKGVFNNVFNFKNYNYSIIDKENFVKTQQKNNL